MKHTMIVHAMRAMRFVSLCIILSSITTFHAQGMLKPVEVARYEREIPAGLAQYNRGWSEDQFNTWYDKLSQQIETYRPSKPPIADGYQLDLNKKRIDWLKAHMELRPEKATEEKIAKPVPTPTPAPEAWAVPIKITVEHLKRLTHTAQSILDTLGDIPAELAAPLQPIITTLTQLPRTVEQIEQKTNTSATALEKQATAIVGVAPQRIITRELWQEAIKHAEEYAQATQQAPMEAQRTLEKAVSDAQSILNKIKSSDPTAVATAQKALIQDMTIFKEENNAAQRQALQDIQIFVPANIKSLDESLNNNNLRQAFTNFLALVFMQTFVKATPALEQSLGKDITKQVTVAENKLAIAQASQVAGAIVEQFAQNPVNNAQQLQMALSTAQQEIQKQLTLAIKSGTLAEFKNAIMSMSAMLLKIFQTLSTIHSTEPINEGAIVSTLFNMAQFATNVMGMLAEKNIVVENRDQFLLQLWKPVLARIGSAAITAGKINELKQIKGFNNLPQLLTSVYQVPAQNLSLLAPTSSLAVIRILEPQMLKQLEAPKAEEKPEEERPTEEEETKPEQASEEALIKQIEETREQLEKLLEEANTIDNANVANVNVPDVLGDIIKNIASLEGKKIINKKTAQLAEALSSQKSTLQTLQQLIKKHGETEDENQQERLNDEYKDWVKSVRNTILVKETEEEKQQREKREREEKKQRAAERAEEEKKAAEKHSKNIEKMRKMIEQWEQTMESDLNNLKKLIPSKTDSAALDSIVKSAKKIENNYSAQIKSLDLSKFPGVTGEKRTFVGIKIEHAADIVHQIEQQVARRKQELQIEQPVPEAQAESPEASRTFAEFTAKAEKIQEEIGTYTPEQFKNKIQELREELTKIEAEQPGLQKIFATAIDDLIVSQQNKLIRDFKDTLQSLTFLNFKQINEAVNTVQLQTAALPKPANAQKAEQTEKIAQEALQFRQYVSVLQILNSQNDLIVSAIANALTALEKAQPDTVDQQAQAIETLATQLTTYAKFISQWSTAALDKNTINAKNAQIAQNLTDMGLANVARIFGTNSEELIKQLDQLDKTILKEGAKTFDIAKSLGTILAKPTDNAKTMLKTTTQKIGEIKKQLAEQQKAEQERLAAEEAQRKQTLEKEKPESKIKETKNKLTEDLKAFFASNVSNQVKGIDELKSSISQQIKTLENSLAVSRDPAAGQQLNAFKAGINRILKPLSTFIRRFETFTRENHDHIELIKNLKQKTKLDDKDLESYEQHMDWKKNEWDKDLNNVLTKIKTINNYIKINQLGFTVDDKQYREMIDKQSDEIDSELKQLKDKYTQAKIAALETDAKTERIALEKSLTELYNNVIKKLEGDQTIDLSHFKLNYEAPFDAYQNSIITSLTGLSFTNDKIIEYAPKKKQALNTELEELSAQFTNYKGSFERFKKEIEKREQEKTKAKPVTQTTTLSENIEKRFDLQFAKAKEALTHIHNLSTLKEYKDGIKRLGNLLNDEIKQLPANEKEKHDELIAKYTQEIQNIDAMIQKKSDELTPK